MFLLSLFFSSFFSLYSCAFSSCFVCFSSCLFRFVVFVSFYEILELFRCFFVSGVVVFTAIGYFLPFFFFFSFFSYFWLSLCTLNSRF